MAASKFKTSESGEKEARSIELTYDFGDDLDAASAKFGDDVVMDAFEKSAKIQLQARVRDFMKAGKDDDFIIAYVQNEWVPGLKTARVQVGTVDKLIKAFGKMSAEDQAKILSAMTAPK